MGKKNRNTATSREPLKMDSKDSFSCLPDDILCRIITFLPFESAVHTTFLSRRWKDLWKKAVVLHGTSEDAVVSILSLLAAFSGNLAGTKWPAFQFHFGHGKDLFAAIAPNNTLHLDFSTGDQQELLETFDWLLPLNLPSRHKWPFRYIRDEILELHPPLPADQMFKIKTLYLVSVSRLSNKELTSLVSTFPFLKSLTIAKCNGVRRLDIKDAATLENLIVLDCLKLEHIYFKGFYLKSLRYRGRLVSFPFISNCWLYMKDVMLAFTQGSVSLTERKWEFLMPTTPHPHHSDYDHSYNKCLKSTLRTIKFVESLTLTRWFFEKSICEKFPTPTTEPFLYELKHLWWIDCSMGRENVNALLFFLKLCPYLEGLYVTIDPKYYNLPSTGRFYTLNDLWKLYHLKVVKITGCTDENTEFSLALRLIPLFARDPVIISKPDVTCVRRLVKVLNQENCPYKFEVVENHDDTYPDHVHMNL